MICTVTLNTSIDKAYRLESPLVDGTVQRVATCIDSAGGKGLNAARAIATCGEDVIATGFVGGHTGRLLCDLLARDGIAERFVRTEAETRCCVNVLEPSGRSTEFLEPGREVSGTEVGALLERIGELAAKADVITLSGSVPKSMGANRSSTSAYHFSATVATDLLVGTAFEGSTAWHISPPSPRIVAPVARPFPRQSSHPIRPPRPYHVGVYVLTRNRRAGSNGFSRLRGEEAGL